MEGSTCKERVPFSSYIMESQSDLDGSLEWQRDDLGTFEESELVELGKGVASVIRKFPSHSHFKKPFVAALLSSNVPPRVIRKTLDGTEHARGEYLRKAAVITDVENELYHTYYPHDVDRTPTVPLSDHNILVNFFLKNCRPEKNPYGTHLTRSVSETHFYHIFKFQSDSKGIGIRTFLRVEKELRIVKAKHGEFDLFFCATCHKFGETKVNENPKTDEEKTLYGKYLDYRLHRVRVATQWNLYQTILKSLSGNPDVCLVVLDFSKKFTQVRKAVIGSLVIFRDRGGGVVNWVGLDFCGASGGESADNYFVQGIWESAFRLGAFFGAKTIHVFHDKGSNELYNSSVLYIYTCLSATYDCKIFPHYFESCHGKGMHFF